VRKDDVGIGEIHNSGGEVVGSFVWVQTGTWVHLYSVPKVG